MVEGIEPPGADTRNFRLEDAQRLGSKDSQQPRPQLSGFTVRMTIGTGWNTFPAGCRSAA